ncbi:putative ankyrin repeat protein RF_0381 isoform X1 [Patella vulgata]|uniref:putative ankyrin repeat protein RF_0381 isoform X1 n=1 Tax=Patella vulgata TaxID=6465 RepID=UPI0024A95EDD|nr:putative ankyrin repeat protein RF_0381 isoform X1 [Patella vulgata]
MKADGPLISKLHKTESDGDIEVVETLSIEDKKQALYIAVEYQLYEILINLLEHDIDLHYVDSRQNNLLHILLDNNRFDNRGRRDLLLQCVVKLVDAGVDVNQVNGDNETPIFIAAKQRLYEVVIYLLNHGVDLHHVNRNQYTLLNILLYCYYDNDKRSDLVFQCVVKLVNAGVDVNEMNGDRYTPIFIAAMRGLYEVVMYLLEYGVDIHYVDSDLGTLMHVLVASDDMYFQRDRRDLLFQCVVKLVDAGVDANQLNKYKYGPISIAACKRFYELVIYLLEHSIDTNVDICGNSLLHTLIRYCNRHDNTGTRDLLLKCIRQVIKAGVDVNQTNVEKLTPIFIAAFRGLYEVVVYLLNYVDVNYVNSLKRNILHYVLSYMCSFVQYDEKYIQLVNTLLKTELDINQPDYRGNTPLFYVGKHNASDDIPGWRMGKSYGVKLKLETGQDIHVPLKSKLISILLEAGCNVNHQNEQGQTALMNNVKYQADIKILKLLVPHSDLSLTDNYNDTAISYCVQFHMLNSTAVFQTLVDAGLDLKSPNNGVKLFLDVLNCKRLELFNYYIGRQLIVNGVTAEGENMLHLLARVNYEYSLTEFYWLLNNELDINHPCSKTNTPTMIAAFLLNSKYLELMTHHPRLEINTQNNQGHTALHICIIRFTMFKDGLNKRHLNDVVKHYCRQIYPIYMAWC